MLSGVLKGGTVLYPLGWRRCPFFVCITYLIVDVLSEIYVVKENLYIYRVCIYV